MKMLTKTALLCAAATATPLPEYGIKDQPKGGGDADPQDFAALAVEVKDALKEVQDFATKASESVRKGEELTAEQKKQIDEALTKLNTLDTIEKRIDEVEQKAARSGAKPEVPQSAGQKFTQSEDFKSFAAQSSPHGRVQVEVKDISSLTTNADGSVGTLIQPDRTAMVNLPDRRMTIRGLLAPGTTSSNTVEYDKEVGFTNNADVVADGDLKPQSEIQYTEADAKVVTIAHWMRANIQTLADIPGLQSMIDNRLRYGLAFREEQQLLNGSGVAGNLSGLITEATAYSAAFAPAAETMIDKVRLSMLQVALAEYAANGVVLNPIDWAYMELLKDTDGRYLIGNPQGTTTPRLWGLPVVPTQAMAPDKFLTGAFDLAAQIFDRQNATVEASTEDGDNFRRNKVTIRGEQRLALAVYRPEAIVYGDLGRVA